MSDYNFVGVIKVMLIDLDVNFDEFEEKFKVVIFEKYGFVKVERELIVFGFVVFKFYVFGRDEEGYFFDEVVDIFR